MGLVKNTRRTLAKFKRRYVPRALILIYHRVADDSVDPWGQCVSAKNFDRQMEIIREMGLRTVHVSEIAEDVRAGRLQKNAVAVSFDDGYSDNLESARPILEHYEIAAAHFATAGYIGSDEPFWWDVLDTVFIRTKHLPEELTITLAGEQHHWKLAGDSEFPKGSTSDGVGWVPLGQPHTRRHVVHDSVWRLLVTADASQRQEAIQQLIDWAEVAPSEWAKCRPMTEDELCALHGDGLVEIGSHSLTHPALSDLGPAMQAHELTASKARLEHILGTKVRGCAYPHGRTSPELMNLARDAGYDFACGSLKRAVGSGSELFALPRISVKNWDEGRFRSLLDHHVAA